MPSSSPANRPTRRRIIQRACAGALALPRAFAAKKPSRDPEVRTLEAGQLEIAFRLTDSGVALDRIFNKATGFEHLAQPSSLFGISSGEQESWQRSDQDFRVDAASSGPAGSLIFRGNAAALPIGFTLSVIPQPEQSAALLKLELHNRGSEKAACRVRVPWIGKLAIRRSGRAMMAALPQEIAGVVSTDGAGAHLGMSVNAHIGLPNAMNTMEVFSLYDPGGQGGVFFSDAEGDLDIGRAPIQFTFGADTVYGHSLVDLHPGESQALPAVAIGVHHSGDWHTAVDDYCRRHAPHWSFPETPSWFRDQGAIYSFSGSGGGAIYMMFPQQDLKDRIASFENLPSLLDEAMRLGTNIVYLWDYWEGATKGGRPQYWNKGDYTPRTDLGGPPAFKEGIRKLHEKGGRVILYVEAFIVFWYSHLGEEKGLQWAGRDPSGSLYHQYPQNYTMVPCFGPWQDQVAAIATRLVRDFDADGIFLDSWGWQLNWPMQTEGEKVLYSPLQFSQGVLALAKGVRAAIRGVKPDAIVMGESTSGALGRCWDGGLSADFAWLGTQNQYRIRGSPVRYAMPTMNVFTNGRTLSELNQVFAAGHHLALLNANLPDADYIRKLVKIRQEYKDALIHGRQVFQPSTGTDTVSAYYYRGSTSEVITVSNHGAADYAGELALDAAQGNSEWKDLLGMEALHATNTSLHVKVAAGGLAVLARDEKERIIAR